MRNCVVDLGRTTSMWTAVLGLVLLLLPGCLENSYRSKQIRQGSITPQGKEVEPQEEPGPSIKVVRIKNSSGKKILSGVRVLHSQQPNAGYTDVIFNNWPQFQVDIPYPQTAGVGSFEGDHPVSPTPGFADPYYKPNTSNKRWPYWRITLRMEKTAQDVVHTFVPTNVDATKDDINEVWFELVRDGDIDGVPAYVIKWQVAWHRLATDNGQPVWRPMRMGAVQTSQRFAIADTN